MRGLLVSIGTVAMVSVVATPSAGLAASVKAAPVPAFGHSVQDVTALAGWPAGRKPASIVTQGSNVFGYVRRSWKPGNNNGNFMDFQAGWRRSITDNNILVRLDNNDLVNVSVEVTHSVPSPGSGGTTRYLDATAADAGDGTAGSPFKSWVTAIAALRDNDVLVVRARAAGEVYPVNLNVGGAVSTASGVQVVADPGDLAAGRRPRIHVQGTKLARYADELNSGHWEVYQDLGSPHGKVWRTTQAVGALVNIGCSYRTKSGGLRRCNTYTNTAGTPGAMARLTDTTYPRVHHSTASEHGLFMGPGIYLHSDNRLYIRLSPLRDGVGAVQVDKTAGQGTNPPWDWSDDDPENEDPNQCQLFIGSSNDQRSASGPPTTNISYNLRINGTSNWTIENLDFVGGGNTIEMNDCNNITLRGCRILGWAPPNMEDIFGQDTVARTHNMLEAENTFGILCERCEFWGGAAPWFGWQENKANFGAYSIAHKVNLWWMQHATDVVSSSIRFVNCLMDGFAILTRPGGKLQYAKFHQCALHYCGMDGLIVCQTPTETLEFIRTQIFEGSLAGWVGENAMGGSMYVGYCLINNFRPFLHDNGWWCIDVPEPNQFVCCKQVIGHGTNPGYKDCERQFFYNNTAIGAHNHLRGSIIKTSGGMAADGAGAFIFPSNKNDYIREWWSRNNILAVRPNGSLGNSSHTRASTWGDSHVAVVIHPTHMGSAVGGATYSADYNIYHRPATMPTVSGNNGVVTVLEANGSEVAQDLIADVRNETGQEQNGRFVDPQFAGSWDARKPDPELHTNAQWCLKDGSPATSGGDATDRSWPDMDFGKKISYGGNKWLGCMDPDASPVEQQVGPLGPMPTEFAVDGATFAEGIPGNAFPAEDFTLHAFALTPFSPIAVIRYEIPVACRMELSIISLQGRRVITLVSKDQTTKPGSYRIAWNGRDEAGRPLATGIYLCRLAVEQRLEKNQEMMLIR